MDLLRKIVLLMVLDGVIFVLFSSGGGPTWALLRGVSGSAFQAAILLSFSFIAKWAQGLAFPLLARFAFRMRPMSRAGAAGMTLVSLFAWFGVVISLAWLTSTRPYPDTSIVMYLVAAYCIFRHRAEPSQRPAPEAETGGGESEA